MVSFPRTAVASFHVDTASVSMWTQVLQNRPASISVQDVGKEKDVLWFGFDEQDAKGHRCYKVSGRLGRILSRLVVYLVFLQLPVQSCPADAEQMGCNGSIALGVLKGVQNGSLFQLDKRHHSGQTLRGDLRRGN